MLELFHRIGDASSARVRKYVTERELLQRLRFRNLTYPEVEQEFLARGGRVTPALWTGDTLIEGADKIMAFLQSYSDVGRDF